MTGLLVYLLAGVSHYILMRKNAAQLSKSEHVGFFALCVFGWFILPVYKLYNKS